QDKDKVGRFFFQAEDGIRDRNVTGVQTCALPIFNKIYWIGTILINVICPGARTRTLIKYGYLKSCFNKQRLIRSYLILNDLWRIIQQYMIWPKLTNKMF